MHSRHNLWLCGRFYVRQQALAHRRAACSRAHVCPHAQSTSPCLYYPASHLPAENGVHQGSEGTAGGGLPTASPSTQATVPPPHTALTMDPAPQNWSHHEVHAATDNPGTNPGTGAGTGAAATGEVGPTSGLYSLPDTSAASLGLGTGWGAAAGAGAAAGSAGDAQSTAAASAFGVGGRTDGEVGDESERAPLTGGLPRSSSRP